MAITPRRRKKEKSEHHQRYKELKHKSDALLLGQSGGQLVPSGAVEIESEGSGYYTISVEVPIVYDTSGAQQGAPAPHQLMLCNSIIDVSLKCSGDIISDKDGANITCEIISSNVNNNTSMGIFLVVTDPAAADPVIIIPYSDVIIQTSVPANTPSNNSFVAKSGKPKTQTFGSSSWNFNFNVKALLNEQSGTIYNLINNFNVNDEAIGSKFIAFNSNTIPIILKFKNIRIVADNIKPDAIDISLKVTNDKNLAAIKDQALRTNLSQFLDTKLNFNTKIPNADTPITEKFGGNEAVVNNFLNKCAYTGADDGIIDIKLVQLIFIFFYIITQDSVRKAKCKFQDAKPIADTTEFKNASDELFNKFYNDEVLFNFLSFVYMSMSRISNPRDLTFKNIFDAMKKITPQYITMGLSPDLLFQVDQGQVGGAIGDKDDNTKNDMFKNIARIIPMQIANPMNNPQDMIVSITVPRLIDPLCGPSRTRSGIKKGSVEGLRVSDKGSPKFGSSEAEGSELDIPSVTDERAAFNIDASFQIDSQERTGFLESDYPATKNYIKNSLSQGQINVQVGDCVQFVLDGKVVKAIICFFKSGKYTYDKIIKYEAASNMVDYYNSLKKDGIQTIINKKKNEPLFLIGLLNLRGFAFLPYEQVDAKSGDEEEEAAPVDPEKEDSAGEGEGEGMRESQGASTPRSDAGSSQGKSSVATKAAANGNKEYGVLEEYTILYDCESDIQRLHNGYNPSDTISQNLKSAVNTLIPTSTEFKVGSAGALKFNTASYMTLKKIEKPPKMFEKFRTYLRSLGMNDEETITKSIQAYIKQYGLSKQCGKTVSPDDINRMRFFQQKVTEVDRQFMVADVFNLNVNQYNVYKSNSFIQNLLTEKISDADSNTLFKRKYAPPVPDLIYWFFTAFARGSDTFAIDNPTRAMVMIFQAFARDSANPNGFRATSLDAPLPGDTDPKPAYFNIQQGGSKWVKGEQGVLVDAATGKPKLDANGEEQGNGTYLWVDEETGHTYQNQQGDDVYLATPPTDISHSPTEETLTPANKITAYIERLIAIVRKNNLYNAQYLDSLITALKEAKRKYTTGDDDDKHLFSATVATSHQAAAIMKAHIDNANEAQEEKDEEARTAKEAAETKAADAATLAHTRQKELLEASGKTSSRGAFDLSHLLKSKDGSNIDNQLGTCISGNNVVISCDGQTVRIDLDLATLLSTCADSFTQSALNGIGKKPKDGEGGESEEEGGGGDGGNEEEGEDDEEEGDDEEDGTGAPAAAAAAAAAPKPNPVQKKPATTAADAAKAKYTAYDTDYQQFKRDPVARYLDYDAEFNKFSEDSTVNELKDEV